MSRPNEQLLRYSGRGGSVPSQTTSISTADEEEQEDDNEHTPEEELDATSTKKTAVETPTRENNEGCMPR